MQAPVLVVGGTFNPIHFGHLQPAIELADKISAAEIRLIPNRFPPHREKPDTSDSDRLNMCQLAAQLDPRFIVDDRELIKSATSYSIDTLIELNQELQQPVCFVMGIDAFNHLDSWHRWQELLSHCHIIVAKRSGYSVDISSRLNSFFLAHKAEHSIELSQSKFGKIYLAKTSKLMISSTYIRQRYQAEKNSACLLPQAVNDYILSHKLYT
ncbi:nicotinate-nucleotide adenylyltransferase [Catenovulum sp. SM1970]|uniref:nicotinate-nucleotide adenylyltransferase n=1 Tax=Marinifaba aquimaris TaxID=2741323 RepID=UPI001571D047|nr:nicotinate-nucleotide adenylyltransferase [Marinifaba aquimaris]NTS78414.1 nicotinate-nucleotide adenylyltransferase [Marinifaba aquimaris]